MGSHQRTRNIRSIAILMTGIVGSQPALAQSKLDLTTEIYSRGSYDSNFLKLSEGDKLANPQLTSEDYTLSVGGSIKASLPMGRQRLYADVAVDYDFHKNNKSLDSDSIRAIGGVDWRLGTRCRGLAEYRFSRRLNEFETVGDLINNTQRTSTAAGDLQCRITGRLAITSGGDISRMDNSTVAREESDRDEWSARAGFRFLTGKDQYIGAFAEYREREFPNRLAIDGISAESNEQIFIGGEVSKRIGGKFNLTGRAGYTEIKDDLDPTASFEGFDGNVALEFRSSKRFQVTLDASRAVTNSDALALPFTSDTGLGLEIHLQPSPRLDILMTGRYKHRSFRHSGAGAAALVEQPLEDDTYVAGGRISLQIIRILNFDIGAYYDYRSSDLETFEYKGARVMAALRLSFD